VITVDVVLYFQRPSLTPPLPPLSLYFIKPLFDLSYIFHHHCRTFHERQNLYARQEKCDNARKWWHHCCHHFLT